MYFLFMAFGNRWNVGLMKSKMVKVNHFTHALFARYGRIFIFWDTLMCIELEGKRILIVYATIRTGLYPGAGTQY